MDIRTIKGVGDKTALLFNKLDIYSTKELLEYYPRAYQCFEPPINIRECQDKVLVAIKGTVAGRATLIQTNRFKIVNVTVRDDNNDFIKITWYNMPFIKSKLVEGATFVFRGKLSYKGSSMVIEQPEMYSVAAYEAKINEMQPVYSLVKGLTNNTVVKAVKNVMKDILPTYDYLPESIRERYNLAEYNYAIENIHFPEDMDARVLARKRLAFDEFFKFIRVLRKFKESEGFEENNYIITRHDETNRIIKELPFELTDAQKKVLDEIMNDISGEKCMNRLIQGDVGSGKTIVAVLAMIDAALSGYQAAIMAPTEVLANQHYEYISELVQKYNLPFRVSLITGSMTAKVKRKEYERIEIGLSKIIIGTHALIQEGVCYDRLALVITDEQHRFGVRQREMLAFKGDKPHILVMSATPIPRTLAIILYGDLDISVMNQMPSNRLPIKNCVVGTDYRPNAYKFIENQVAMGHQAYIICAMVEESESIEAENVTDYCEKLKEILPESVKVEYLHGKMKPALKNSIMDDFANKKIDVLVSTTVIEVGINVPNATVMLIEDAQRFGLAALHQLRGRVGRGKDQSYCIFINTSKNKDAQKRLEILNNSNDGFFIASEDMKLRGPGDFFGIRQSGEMDFNIADIYCDSEILKQASEASELLDNGEFDMSQREESILIEEMNAWIEKASSNINL